MMKTQLVLAAAGLIGATALSAQTVVVPQAKVFRSSDDSTLIKRAAIGVQVQTTGTKRDTLGVFIARVTPDGPAEKAGIIEGERIASINGVDLRVAVGDVEDSYTAGLASHRLTREIRKLAPGARVNLRINSGGRIRDVQVTTGRASDVHKLDRSFGLVLPRMPTMPAMPSMQHMQILKENMEPLLMRTPRPSGLVRTSI